MHRLAVYPGSFDPPTLGHLDVMERAARLFDRLVVAVGANAAKTPFLSVEDRMAGIRAATAHLPNVTVDRFEGLLVEYALGLNAKSIVRGLRATSDFEYEFQMAMVNRRLTDQVDSVFLMTKWEHSYLSSSVVREVAILGGDYREMVPQPVAELLDRVLGKSGG
jgi:pantetheine-phosphate adenylyltransferase